MMLDIAKRERCAGLVMRRFLNTQNLHQLSLLPGFSRSTYLSDSVGLGAVGDLGGAGAVGGVLLNDLSDDGDVAVVVASRDAGGSGKNGSNGELHFVGN